jgi:hypothetical protein
MSSDGKRGFFSSLFGSRRQKEDQEAADLDSRHRLEKRIEQILAEQVQVPQLLKEEDPAAVVAQQEAEPDIDLLPITASVFNRKGPIPASFLPASVEANRFYAANEHW